MDDNIKIYSNREITIATFFGGPLAAGYLVKKNYQVMRDTDKANKSFWIGIITTIVLFIVIFSLPESVLDKTPQQLIPIIYTSIISLIVNNLQGQFIKAHKENGGQYHSGWKVAKVGVVSMLILLATIAIVAFFAGDFSANANFDSTGYNKEVAKFTENESKSIEVFKVLSTADTSYLKGEFTKSLELWKGNKEIINKLNYYKNLPKELHSQNQILLEYCDLRIQQSKLFIKLINEDTDKYTSDINRIGEDIDKNIKLLK